MSLVSQVRGINKLKEPKLAKLSTRQQDMPVCAGCLKPIVGAAVAGYDGEWRCLSCNRVHGEAVLLESGDSAPLPSDESIAKPAPPPDELAEKRRQKRADEILERYGVTRKSA